MWCAEARIPLRVLLTYPIATSNFKGENRQFSVNVGNASHVTGVDTPPGRASSQPAHLSLASYILVQLEECCALAWSSGPVTYIPMATEGQSTNGSLSLLSSSVSGFSPSNRAWDTMYALWGAGNSYISYHRQKFRESMSHDIITQNHGNQWQLGGDGEFSFL